MGARPHGKWSDPGVPHKGWEFIDFEDLGEPSAVCEMCEFQTIRFVHVMQHRDYSTPLRCGCECAGKMSGDYEAAEQRERLAKNVASRRARWLVRNWKTSNKGYDYLKTDGFLITVFPDGSRWKACVADSVSDRKQFSSRTFPTEDKAKLAAFDAMVQFKPEWRP
jgi:hypothetical protein